MTVAKYKPILVNFMSFRDGHEYEMGHKFTDAELGMNRPTDVRSWFQLLLALEMLTYHLMQTQLYIAPTP